MPAELLFISVIGLIFAVLITWGFRVLPREEWQIFACLPVRRDQSGGWHGRNLTWYGIFAANANLIATSLALVMLAALGLPLLMTLSAIGSILAISVPAARWLAWLIEKRKGTFTVAGASFMGFIFGPWILCLHFRYWPGSTDISALTVPAMAGLTAAYAVGEGLGRLACLSFGCCYGKPLSVLPAWGSRLLSRFPLVFDGCLKKACYEGGLSGQKTIPVQAMTAIVCTCLGLAATVLILHRCPTAAYLLATFGTQVWRFLSELLRADYRGGGRLSAYQIMSLFACAYAVIITLYLPAGATSPNLGVGLRAVWHPGVLIFLQVYWMIMVWFMGLSTVTKSHLQLRLSNEPR